METNGQCGIYLCPGIVGVSTFRNGVMDEQRELLTRYAARLGLNVAEVYEDHWLFGSGVVGRPRLRQLLRDAETGRFRHLVAGEFSTLTKDPELAPLFDRLRGAGVTVHVPGVDEVEACKNKKAVFYLRRTPAEPEGVLVDQRERLKREAGREGMEVLTEYVDSGDTGPSILPPQLRQLMRDARKGGFRYALSCPELSLWELEWVGEGLQRFRVTLHETDEA